MSTSVKREVYEVLRDALTGFVAASRQAEVAPFRDNVATWDRDRTSEDPWSGADVAVLPASGFLGEALPTATAETRDLVALFNAYRDALKWEQSYTARDAVVGDDMLSGYGFVEVIGKNGPFVSTSVRLGIGVWGPGIDYPVHRHAPEEVYVPLAGAADFTIDGSPYMTRRAGDAVHVVSGMPHGFRTTDEPFIVLYIWQAGDLREKSTFG